MFNWIKGRQNTGYEKLKLFQFLVFDCYILRYKVGDYIPEHTDPVPGYRHYRLNFVLKKAEEGGISWFHHPVNIPRNAIVGKNMTFFRSDIVPHGVTEIKKGERIVLTFGICLPI